MNLPALQKDERPQSKGLQEYQTGAIRKVPHEAGLLVMKQRNVQKAHRKNRSPTTEKQSN